jgi:hypothetical protein
VLGFKHPLSKFVHETYVTDQTELTCEREFANYKNKMRIEFGIHIDECVFDRDPAFNEKLLARICGSSACIQIPPAQRTTTDWDP